MFFKYSSREGEASTELSNLPVHGLGGKDGVVCCGRTSGPVTACEDCPASWRVSLLWVITGSAAPEAPGRPSPCCGLVVQAVLTDSGLRGVGRESKAELAQPSGDAVGQPRHRDAVLAQMSVPAQPDWRLCQAALCAGPGPALQACLLPRQSRGFRLMESFVLAWPMPRLWEQLKSYLRHGPCQALVSSFCPCSSLSWPPRPRFPPSAIVCVLQCLDKLTKASGYPRRGRGRRTLWLVRSL